MNVSSTGASAAWPVAKSIGTRSSTTTRETAIASAGQVTGDFLKYAKMSPMERMRANILKSMDLTEDRLSALPQQERQKIEEQIKDQVKKRMDGSGGKEQRVDILV